MVPILHADLIQQCVSERYPESCSHAYARARARVCVCVGGWVGVCVEKEGCAQSDVAIR